MKKKNHEVLIGNGNTEKVFVKGSVERLFTSRKKLVLLNVFHIPEIRKNLISANLLCKKGLKIVLEPNKVAISKNGVFLGKGCSCDGMLKLSINSDKNILVFYYYMKFVCKQKCLENLFVFVERTSEILELDYNIC